jgi:hypothetical protein
MIILPTLRRPDNLRRFIKAYKATGGTLPIHVVFDELNTWQYADIELPPNWKRVSAPAGTPIGHIFNFMFMRFSKEDYYGMVADDVVPETNIWDVILRDSCMPNKIAWGCDGIQNEKLPTHPFIGGELIRKLGWWAAPGLHHWFVDNAWKAIADEFKVGVYLPQLKMTHHHFLNGKAQRDRTYDQQPNHQNDAIIFNEFMKLEFPKIKERLGSDESIIGGRRI